MTPLVLVHGFMGGAAQWAEQEAAFGDTCEVIALDLPGFGANAHLAPINSIGGFAQWVMAEISARNITRYHLMGHSMGGMIAQEVARRDATRIASLVLYATGSVGVMPGRFESIAESKARAVQDGAVATARRIAATWFLDTENAAGFEGCAQIAQQAGIGAILSGLDAMQGWSGTAQLSQITAPTLVLWGDKDRTYAWEQPRRLWSDIPNAHLAVLAGCAHAVHLEKPQLFNDVVRDFLNTHP